MEFISFFNNKGGVTKSTSAMLLGELVATCEFPCIIIDADQQGTLSLDTYGLKRESIGLAEILKNPERLSEAVHQTRVKNLFVIPPGNNLDKTAVEFEQVGDLKKRTRRVMDLIRTNYAEKVDLVIVDNPPRLEGISTYTSEYSEKVILPSQTEEAAFKAVVRVYIEMQKTFEHWEKQDVYVLITKHNTKRNASMIWLQMYHQWVNTEAERFANAYNGKKLVHRVLKTTVPDSADVENIKIEKANIYLKKSTSDVAKGYIGAFNEIYPDIQIGEKLKQVIEDRKAENIKQNLIPNTFKKKQETASIEVA